MHRLASIQTALLALAATALGVAINEANGMLTPAALHWLEVTCVSAALAIACGAIPERILGRVAAPPQTTWLLVCLLALVAYQGGLLASTPPVMYGRFGPDDSRWFVRGVVALTALATAQAFALGRPRALLLGGLVALHGVIGIWLLRASPAPNIDVFYFQRDACAALLGGHNPYTITYPNIYGDATPFYGAGLSAHGRLQFGYLYPPLSLLLALPGHLAGDFRYSQLIAMEGAAVLIASLGGDRVGGLAAALFLLTPRAFFVLEQGWTEPYVVILLVATVYAAHRVPRALPYVLGLFLCVKQYLVFAIVPSLVLVPWREAKAARAFAVRTILTAAAVTVPLMVWDFRAFWKDVVQLQLMQPVRSDALSYFVWLSRDRPTVLPFWVCFAVAGLATVVAFALAPKTAAGFAQQIAFVLLCFFASSKQAFANYYFSVIGAFCCACAARTLPVRRERGVAADGVSRLNSPPRVARPAA